MIHQNEIKCATKAQKNTVDIMAMPLYWQEGQSHVRVHLAVEIRDETRIYDRRLRWFDISKQAPGMYDLEPIGKWV